MNDGLAMLVIAAAAMAVALSLAIVLYAHIRGRGRPASIDPREGAELLRQMERLARHIDESSEQRLRELRELTAQADQRLAEIRGLLHHDGPGQSSRQASRGRIIEMSLLGMDPVEIARRLEMPVGEVELMLHLPPAADKPLAATSRQGET